MSRNFTLGQLTEGIRDRNVGQDGGRLINKWTRTGLLRGLNEHKRENMARLLENQAAQVLREANTLGSGQGGSNVHGFSNIAFPIVRRVFGGLVANELVSIQPMSLPSGLLFYLDYSYGSDVGHAESGTGNAGNIDTSTDPSVFNQGSSLYGSPDGRDVRLGADATGGMYDLAGSTYSKVYKHLSGSGIGGNAGSASTTVIAGASSQNTDNDSLGAYNAAGTWTAAANIETTNSKNLKLVQYDPQIIKEINEHSTAFSFILVDCGQLSGLDKTNAKGIGLHNGDQSLTTAANGLTDFSVNDSDGTQYQQGQKVFNLRRLNQFGTWDENNKVWTPGVNGNDLLMVVKGTYSHQFGSFRADMNADEFCLAYPVVDSLASVSDADSNSGAVLTIPSFESGFTAGSDGSVAPIIPEIDIKIESIAVTAQTRKLRARWSPELAQDLNAYHSLDAEVELTQILSEQIALEIDREILNDLLVEAAGANFYWSRAPGKFVNKRSGAVQNLASTLATGPQFTGTVREWYETLVETIIDVANEIHRKTLRGSANFIVVSPEVATIFEASVLYKPSIKIDGQGQVAAPFSLGAEAIGSLSNRFTVYKDPYFPRNKILVGYKGGSYLESGYVYAPYVPLIVTPTIFAPEDFTPRKGVMTRYGKKMVRADFYGTVTCLDMDVI